MPDGRVLIALDDGPLVASPTWTRIDDTDNLVAGIDIRRGRQSEQDRTDTGTATVWVNDTARLGALFDPANATSPYFGKLDGAQIMLQLRNPVDGIWYPQFRGLIDMAGYDLHPSAALTRVSVECVDVFDFLGGCQMAPGYFGDTPPVGNEGVIFYEDTAGTVDDRIIQALTDAGIASAMRVVFSGNVSVQETKYDAGDAVLVVLRDAADAEFPGLANIYVDKKGRFVFHGRYARFTPEAVEATTTPDIWDFNRWKVGDGAAFQLDADRAQIRVLSYTRGRREVINAAIAWPHGMPQEEIPDQVIADATSITNYGYHALPPMEDLIINEGTTTGNTGKVECQKFAQVYVNNLKDPRTRIRLVTLKSVWPTDARAEPTWDVLCKADISDIMNVEVGYPGGTGLVDEDYYIEGVTQRIRPLNPDFDFVEVDFDLSPPLDPTGVFD